MTPTPFSGYSITKSGKCFSHKRNIWLSPDFDYVTGRYSYQLHINGKKKRITIARLNLMSHKPVRNMAKLEADHISGNKENDRLYNLQWLTPSQNCKKRWKR